MRSKSEIVRDWVTYYRQSPLNYQMSALIACFKSDGEEVLRSVLKELGLTLSVDLVRDAVKRS